MKKRIPRLFAPSARTWASIDSRRIAALAVSLCVGCGTVEEPGWGTNLDTSLASTEAESTGALTTRGLEVEAPRLVSISAVSPVARELGLGGYLVEFAPDGRSVTVHLLDEHDQELTRVQVTEEAGNRWTFASSSETFYLVETSDGAVLSLDGERPSEFRFSRDGGFTVKAGGLHGEGALRLMQLGHALHEVGEHIMKKECRLRCRIARFFIRAGCVLIGLGCCFLADKCAPCLEEAGKCWDAAGK